MKTYILMLAWAFVVAADVRLVLGQEVGQPTIPPGPDPRVLMLPGPEHEQLARYVGAWDVEILMGSGAQAAKSQGSATSRMTVGGRFLQIEYQTAKSDKDALDGMFTIGFDRRHQRYSLVAFDTFGTYFVTSQGKQNKMTGAIRLLGTDDDPTMKALGYTKEFVHVLDLRGPDEYAIEVRFIDTRTAARREIKAMEYVLKRKK